MKLKYNLIAGGRYYKAREEAPSESGFSFRRRAGTAIRRAPCAWQAQSQEEGARNLPGRAEQFNSPDNLRGRTTDLG